MAFQKADGTPITSEAALKALATNTSETVEYYAFTDPIYQTFSAPGTEGENYRRLAIPSNVTLTGDQIDAMFPAATFTSVTPAVAYSTGLIDVKIVGTNLSGTSAITFGGTAATNVAVLDNEHVTCTVPAHSAGAVDIVITDDSGTLTATDGFTYVTPTFTSITPDTGSHTGGTPVTIVGTHFQTPGITGVKIGGAAATAVTIVSDTQITCTTPAGTAGEVAVEIDYPHSGTLSTSDAYTYS